MFGGWPLKRTKTDSEFSLLPCFIILKAAWADHSLSKNHLSNNQNWSKVPCAMEHIHPSAKSYHWTKIVVDPDRSHCFNLRLNFSPDLVLFNQVPNERGIPKEDWHLSDQKHQWLRLAVQTHLQISSAPFCLRAALLLNSPALPRVWRVTWRQNVCHCHETWAFWGYLMQKEQIYDTFICFAASLYSNVLMSGFAMKENSESVEPSAHFCSGILVSS